MKNNSFNRILKKTPESTKIFVSKSLDVAERVNAILEKKGKSQKDLAEELGKRPSEINKWLSGLHNFTLKSISKLEAILGEPILITPPIEEEDTSPILVALFISSSRNTVKKLKKTTDRRFEYPIFQDKEETETEENYFEERFSNEIAHVSSY